MDYNFKVEQETVGNRLDVFLLERLEGITRSQIKNFIKQGAVKIDGKVITKAGQVLKLGKTIEAVIEEIKTNHIEPENIPLDIVYEDEYLAVINKPAGMVVHPAIGNYTGTLVNALVYHFKQLSDINDPEIRPGIVHRLDKDTTGLLVIAKTNEAHLSLAEQISKKTATRIYRAICSGVFKEDTGIINKNIGRSTRDRIKMAVCSEGRGKTAVTEYIVLKRFNYFTYVQFKLQTGRTHQIRVHSKYIGHPVLGDTTYGYNHKTIKISSQLLHAYKLSFVHPITKKFMEFKAELPEPFSKVLKKLL